jgi:multiple sugar transport system substrate-binding protein
MKKVLLVFVLVGLLIGTVSYGSVAFISTQFHPATEREFFEGNLLPAMQREKGIDIRFLPLSYEEANTRIQAEQAAGRVIVNLYGDLQSGFDLMAARGLLRDMSDIKFPDRTFISTFEYYAKGHGVTQFIPWLQATFLMVVNAQAFDYLPAGLTRQDVMNASPKWTYDALLAWAKNITRGTGRPMVGFPESTLGLWHRFLHGHIFPAFTGGQMLKFDSLAALDMWAYLTELFDYVNPAGSTWSAMSEPLLRNEVWIAWDHTARLGDAIRHDPDRFIPVPLPAGPAGRGYITVLVGLGIPKDAPAIADSIKAIDYLTSPKVQNQILEVVGFFPVVEEAVGIIPEGPMRSLASAVIAQSSAPDSLVAFIPGLGARGGDFNNVYRTAFQRIVINKEDAARVVKELAPQLVEIFKDVQAPIPQPDAGYYQ